MTNKQIISPFLGDHDHDQCFSDAMQTAISECEQQGLKLTKIRRQVLEIVWSQHHPIGAYDVLQKLQEAGHKPAPPTAYRALDFLVHAHLIHRIESLNAYIGCPSPNHSHQCQFFICSDCGNIAELNSKEISSALASGAESLGFKARQPIIEIHGLCSNCPQTTSEDS